MLRQVSTSLKLFSELLMCPVSHDCSPSDTNAKVSVKNIAQIFPSNLDLASHFHSFCSGNYHRRNLDYQDDWLQYKFMISNLSWASLAAQQPFCSSLVGSLARPQWLNGKESTCSAGVAGLIPGLGRPPWEENGNPLQYYCLGNPMERGAWGCKESDTT